MPFLIFLTNLLLLLRRWVTALIRKQEEKGSRIVERALIRQSYDNETAEMIREEAIKYAVALRDKAEERVAASLTARNALIRKLGELKAVL